MIFFSTAFLPLLGDLCSLPGSSFAHLETGSPDESSSPCSHSMFLLDPVCKEKGRSFTETELGPGKISAI